MVRAIFAGIFPQVRPENGRFLRESGGIRRIFSGEAGRAMFICLCLLQPWHSVLTCGSFITMDGYPLRKDFGRISANYRMNCGHIPVQNCTESTRVRHCHESVMSLTYKGKNAALGSFWTRFDYGKTCQDLLPVLFGVPLSSNSKSFK
jgi:hypothetical protein